MVASRIIQSPKAVIVQQAFAERLIKRYRAR